MILLDCCLSLGMLTINSLAAADEFLISMQAHYLSIKGLEQLIRTVSNVERKSNPGLKIASILGSTEKPLSGHKDQETQDRKGKNAEKVIRESQIVIK